MKEQPLTFFEFQDSEGIDFYAIFSFIWHYRLKFFWFGLISALVLCSYMLISWILPPALSPWPDMYCSNTQLSLNYLSYTDLLSNFSSVSATNLTQTLTANPFSGYSYGEYLKKLILSNTILDKLIAEFKLKSRYRIPENKNDLAREKLKNHLTLDFEEKTQILNINFEDYDPFFATQLANRLVEILNERLLELKTSRHLMQKTLLDQKLAEVKTEVDNIEKEIKNFQSKYGILEVESLSTEKINLLASLRSQLILKEIEIRSYTSLSQIEDANLKRLRSEQANLQKIIADLEAGSNSLNTDLPSQKLLSEIIFEANNLKRTYQIRLKIYELLLQEYEVLKLKLALAGEEPSFQIIEKAKAPDSPASPSRFIIIFLSWLAINFFWFLILIIINWFKAKKKALKLSTKGLTLK